jgi:DNA polymerase-3 subunit epsilon
MYVIVFDTETFGRVDSLDNDIGALEMWPKIRQLCWQNYSLNGKLIKTSNHYFDSLEHNKSDILKEFKADFINAAVAVAHNFQFDYKIIGSELLRIDDEIESFNSVPIYDSMTSNVNLCGLKSKLGFAKYPTLTELYSHLFNEGFEGAHDALNDVEATAKCFWHLRFNSKIDYDELPDVKEAILFETEKNQEEISIIFGTRKDYGEFIFRACQNGSIGILIKQVEDNIKEMRFKEMPSPLVLGSNPENMLSWIIGLENVYLNGLRDQKRFYEYVELRALKETVEFLKCKNLYHPKGSSKLYELTTEMHILPPQNITKELIKSIEFYILIQNIISKYELREKQFSSDIEKLTKENSGCIVALLLLPITYIFSYFY